VTNVTLDKNITTINRNAEIRNRRANVAPVPFQARPVVTVQVRCTGRCWRTRSRRSSVAWTP
jgi:hypothetical protein